MQEWGGVMGWLEGIVGIGGCGCDGGVEDGNDRVRCVRHACE